MNERANADILSMDTLTDCVYLYSRLYLEVEEFSLALHRHLVHLKVTVPVRLPIGKGGSARERSLENNLRS